MPNRILHLIDPTSSADALELLASILHNSPAADSTEHRIVGIGHHRTRQLAQRAGILSPPKQGATPKNLPWIPSIGWADPTGWRGVHKILRQWNPTHVHAWGVHGIVATEITGFDGTRIATFAEVPGHLPLLKRLDRRSNKRNTPWNWLATSSAIAAELNTAGLNPQNIAALPLSISTLHSPSDSPQSDALKEDLGLTADHHPIILLGGEGPRARHDHGLWSAAILQQIFPKTRAILREDVHGITDLGLRRFSNALPQENMLIIGPSELSWHSLLPLADILLITPDGPTSVGSVLHAMAAGVPVIATPTPELNELIQHNHTGLLANGTKPREIAAQLEVFMNDPTLGPRLASNAQKEFASRFNLPTMLHAYRQLYLAESPATLAAAT